MQALIKLIIKEPDYSFANDVHMYGCLRSKLTAEQ